MLDAPARLQSALSDRYRLEREIGSGGHGHGLSRVRPQARARGRAQDPPPRARRRARLRSLPRRDQDHGAARSSAHPHAHRFGRRRQLLLLRTAVRPRRVAARQAEPRQAARPRRSDHDHAPDRERARLRAPPRRGASRHQAREHPAAGRGGDARRFRHRARGEGGRRQPPHRDRPLARHAAVHVPRTGHRRPHARRAQRCLFARRGALRDARRRAARDRAERAGDDREAHDGAPHASRASCASPSR